MRRLLNLFGNMFKKIRFTTPVATIIGMIFVALSILAHGYITSSQGPTKNTTLFAGRSIDDSDIIEGSIKNKVIIAEYSDPECPYCISVYPTMKQLREEYKDKVSFVYRHFPLTQIHPHAFDESKAITCAQSLGGNVKANEYIDAVYGYKSAKQTTQLVATGKEDLAKNIGLDMTAFKNCMADQTTDALVSASITDGVAAGVQGTPSSFVLLKTRKGYEVISMIDGARPYSFFKAAVDEALAR